MIQNQKKGSIPWYLPPYVHLHWKNLPGKGVTLYHLLSIWFGLLINTSDNTSAFLSR